MTPNPFYRQRSPRDEPPLDCSNPFALSARVGEWGANGREDVGKIEVLMKLAGVHDLEPTDGPTGFFGSRLRTAVRAYQKNRGLTVDGEINPDGETLRTLAHDLQHMAPVNAVNNPETHREDFMDSLAERLGINLSKKAKRDPRTMDALLGAISFHKQTAKEKFQTLSKIASLAYSFPEFGKEGLQGNIAVSISDPAKEPWSMTTEELHDLKARNQQTIQALEALEKVDDFLNEEIDVKTHWETFMDITGLKEAFERSNQRIDDELMNR